MRCNAHLSKLRKRTRGACVRACSKKIQLAEVQLETDPTNEEVRGIFSNSQGKLAEVFQESVERNRHLSSSNWLRYGDTCSKSFFDFHRVGKKRTLLKELETESGTITAQKDFSQFITGFYASLYSSEAHLPGTREAQEECWASVPTMVSQEISENLTRNLTKKDILDAIKAPQRESARTRRSSDGILPQVGGRGRSNPAQRLFRHAQCRVDLGLINKGLITLIPKTGDRARLGNWRPITLLGSIYKILAKTLAGRIQPALSHIIRPNQTGFVEGRSILDNIFMAQEALGWAEESDQDLVLLLLDFEKAFDRIEWGFLFSALIKLSFSQKWVRWFTSLYQATTSAIKINGTPGLDFQLARSVRQGCPLAPYLFILAMDVLGYMLADPKHRVEGLTLPRGGLIRDQTFADDTALYLKGTPENMDRARDVLKTFCLASGAKINWHKSAAIWASKRERTWEWGEDVGLKWIPPEKGTRYLGIQVGFHLPTEANFDAMMLNLKSKLISWSHCSLSLAGRILVANQVLLASIWYLAASWNPSPKMCVQVRGVIRNFIWGGKDASARAKVNWNTLALPTTIGGLGVTDPKSQSEALLAKLLIRGLAPGGEPWKELVRHKADQTRLPVHSKGPSNLDLNWLLAAPKLKRLQCSMWKSIVGAWLNVRSGLEKSDPSTAAEILRQPLFGNPSILNTSGSSLGVSEQREGNAFAQSGCSRVKDIWCERNRDWKGLTALGMRRFPANKKARDLIVNSIPWRPDEHECLIKKGDWISEASPGSSNTLDWVYMVLECNQTSAKAIEFKKTAPSGRLQATTNQPLTISISNYHMVRVLSQESPGAALKVAREPLVPGKKPLLYWIHDTGFIQDLPWDPGEWHWRAVSPMGDAPFFDYTAKRGYTNA
jgi:hypothetical protein